MRTLPVAQLVDVYNIDNSILPMLAEMETNGMPVDPVYMRQLGAEFQVEMDTIRYNILPFAWPEFNPDSPDQVADLLFDKLRLKPGKKTPTGKRFTTDDKILEKLKHDHEVVKLLQDYRGVSKLKGTFIDGILKNLSSQERLHTQLNHATAVTGRLSSSEPNLQNIPAVGPKGKKIRSGFRAKDDRVLMVGDMSQFQLRILADFTQDPVMLDAYHNNQDLHSKTAASIGGYAIDQVPKELRTASKRFNFGMVFGISDPGLQDQLRGDGYNWPVEQVAKFRVEWFKVYKSIQPAMEAVSAYVRQHGYIVCMNGRPRRLPGIWSDVSKIRAEAERQAFNHIIQGGEAIYLKMIMARIWNELEEMERESELPIMCLLQVHDELIFEQQKDERGNAVVMKRLDDIMRETVKLSIPVFGEVKLCQNWGEK